MDTFPIVVSGLSLTRPRRRPRLLQRPGPRHTVLHEVHFQVNRGAIFALLGENGAGKTTILKVLAGLTIPDSGSIHLLGMNSPAALAKIRRTKVAYASGEQGLYTRLSVLENLRFYGLLSGLSMRRINERIEELAHILDLDADLSRDFAKLSLGQRQRVSLARALLIQPAILLLDEPTRALDPLHAQSLRRFITEQLVGKHDVTVILATNLLDEAHELGNAIAILREGRLMQIDRTRFETTDHATLAQELFAS